jgi:hypothetical protein
MYISIKQPDLQVAGIGEGRGGGSSSSGGSSSRTVAPNLCMLYARLTATVLLPTPPLQLLTAMTCRTCAMCDA